VLFSEEFFSEALFIKIFWLLTDYLGSD